MTATAPAGEDQLTDGQRELRARARSFVEEVLMPLELDAERLGGRLPAAAVATIREQALAGRLNGGRHAVERERARIEGVVLRARLRAWLAYLSRALELAEGRAQASDPHVVSARELARAVISNHHNLLLGLPGSAARRTAAERARLTREGDRA